VLAGEGREHWTPAFALHGFRYAEIEGWPGDLGPDDVRALVVHSDMTRTGRLSVSDPLLDRLHENVVWSMRGNFVGLPTDCPQRDERLGWTGDIQVFAPAAAFLHDCAGTLVSWLRDVAAEQRADGAVPNYVPWLPLGFPDFDSAAWGDAVVVVPWTLYQRFGDRRVLRELWPAMTGYVDYLASLAGPDGLITDGFQLGDWLDPAAPPERPGDSRTDRHLVANAYLVHSSRLVARAAELVGSAGEAERYAALSARTLTAFRAAYAGRPALGTPTALALAIAFDLLASDGERLRAGARLAELTAAGGDVIQTGFVGTPIICDALADTGQAAAAYRLLLQTECPSWLYQVVMGATTTWERWDSLLPDGTINPGEMTSFNHYAFGAIADFVQRRVAGLAPAAPGYRVVCVDPLFGPLEHASATLDSPYGSVGTAWRREGDGIVLDVDLPAGVSATVVPAGDAHVVGPGRHSFAIPEPTTN
jgi:alpha-L-rhamnosidase